MELTKIQMKKTEKMLYATPIEQIIKVIALQYIFPFYSLINPRVTMKTSNMTVF